MATDAGPRDLGRLAEEQAALRRVATLVAEGATEPELFAGLAQEVARVLGVQMVTIDRYGSDGSSTVLASLDDPGFPVGSRWPLDGPSLGATVLATGHPARVDDYRGLESTSAAAARAAGVGSTVGVPIIVDAAVWGVVCVGTTDAEPLPPETEERLVAFTELAAIAIANNDARNSLGALVDEQAALRRVATLVAEGAPPGEIFTAVVEDVARLFDLEGVTLSRLEPDAAVVVADPFDTGFPVGSRWPYDGESLSAKVLATGRTARIDDYSELEGAAAATMRASPWRSAVGVPIVVDGTVWGVLCVGAPAPELLPADTGERVAGFIELVATAIANIAAGDRVRRLVAEQESLRRVATLVAEGTSTEKLVAAVCEEVARVIGMPSVTLDRYDPDGSATTVLGSWQAEGQLLWPAGSRWPLDGPSVAKLVWETGRPAQLTDYTGLSGAIAAHYRASPRSCAIGVPIIVDNRVWGLIAVGSSGADDVPPDAEARLAGFTQLVATAIANSQARDGLRLLADEQAALRRVATLVVEGVGTDELFAVVAEEVGRVVGVPNVTLDRYEPDGSASVVLACSQSNEAAVWPVGSRWPLDGPSVAKEVWDTGKPAAIMDYTQHGGAIATHFRDCPQARAIGVPILVDGNVWGLICVGSTQGEPVPADAEARLVGFTELLATAISNTEARHRVGRLADEQASLRRVATLVAQDASAAELFSAVAEEVGHVLGVPGVSLDRYDQDGSTTVLATWGVAPFPAGTRWPVEPGTVAGRVLETGRPARLNDYTGIQGDVASALHEIYPNASIVGVPIIVGGRVWGIIGVGTPSPEILPPDTETRLASFTELVATAIANQESRDGVRRLADEQAALRRVATLVAEGATAAELCTAVVKEVWDLLEVPAVTLDRYEPDGTSTVLAAWGDFAFPPGSSWPVDPGTAAWKVLVTGRPARVEADGYAALEGPVAEAMRRYQSVSIVGVPIEVDGKVWGIMGVASPEGEPLPPAMETRLSEFTELVATAISNTQSRDSLRTLVDEQAALRRVATLVAQDPSPAELFAAVSAEVDRVFGLDPATFDVAVVGRFEPGPELVVVGISKSVDAVPLGSRWPTHDVFAPTHVLRTGRSARIGEDDLASLGGEVADFLRQHGYLSQVASPIVVEGRLWGAISVNSRNDFPPDTGDRLERFTELVATAISNTESRDRLRTLVQEQAALHRVAALVARGTDSAAIFDAVCEETGPLVGATSVNLNRFTVDEHSLTIAGWSLRDTHLPIGTRLPLAPDAVGGLVRGTGEPGRLDSYEGATSELALFVRSRGIRSSVAAPVVVEGELWGALIAGSDSADPLPVGTEDRLARFTELLATAISNADARDGLRALAEEQAALHRVAALVARGGSAQAVFDAVCAEAGPLLGAAAVTLSHYTPDGYNETFAGWSLRGLHLPVGTRLPITPDTLGGKIVATQAPARVDDWSKATSELARRVRELGNRSAVGAPVVVEGRLWGALVAATDREEPLPPGTEAHLARFTELVATAISNATTRAELIASRARIVAAGDEARRRIERNLHDSTQQQLIALGLDLQAVRANVPPELRTAHEGFELIEHEIQSVLEDVRELSRGLHPALLARGGLRPSLRGLARRSPIPVDFSIDADERPPEPVETCVYYVVSEALTNAVKHSHANAIRVSAGPVGSSFRATIEDDGIGGAEAGVGSGLVGLIDRVEALGGRFDLDSPVGGGTRITIDLPLEGPG